MVDSHISMIVRKHLLMEIKKLGCQQEHVTCDAELMEDEDGAPIIVMLWRTKGAFSYTLQICQFILQVPWVCKIHYISFRLSVVVALEN
jgi:hypothetical protein